jgi:hypothetical protein
MAKVSMGTHPYITHSITSTISFEHLQKHQKPKSSPLACFMKETFG